MIRLLLLALLALPALAEAACTGTSPNLTAPTWSDVATCYASASSGDTITVTPGSYTVSSGTSFSTTSKYVILVLTGVTITDNTADASCLLDISESTVGSYQLYASGTWIQGTTRHTAPHGSICANKTVGGKPIILRDGTYTAAGSSGNFLYWNVNRGVIYNWTSTGTPQGSQCNNTASFIRIKPGIDGTWETPAGWGNDDLTGENKVYLDKLTLNYMGEGIDIDNNARAVLRFSDIKGWGPGVHGDTDPGGRYIEIYKSKWSSDTTSLPAACGGDRIINSGQLLASRAGTARVVDNELNTVDTNGYWGGVKNPISFQVYQLRRSCWNGGYPCPRCVGWGYTVGGTSLSTSGYAGGAYPDPEVQDLEPIYIAGNTGAAAGATPPTQDYPCASSDACDYPDEATCNARPAASTFAQADREWYQQNASFAPSSTSSSNLTTGTGYGTRANRPASCTAGTVYWSTDQGSWNTSGSNGFGQSTHGVLDKCTSANTWTNNYYVPFAYPHPLLSLSADSGISGSLAPRGRPRWHGPHAKPDRLETP